MHEQLRHKLLGRWSDLICDYPKAALITAGGLAVVCVLMTIGFLGFQPDRNDLLSPDLPWNARYMTYIQTFSGDDIIVVVRVPDDEAVNGDGVAMAERFVDGLGERLRRDQEHVKEVFDGLSPGEVPAGFIRTLPIEEMDAIYKELAASQIIVQSANVTELLQNISNEMRAWQGDGGSGESGAASEIEELAEITGAIRSAVTGESSGELSFGLREEKQYLRFPQEPGVRPKVMLMQVAYRPRVGELDAVTPVVLALREHIAAERKSFPMIEAGLTGVPVIEADETLAATSDATRSSILAVVLISILLIVAFHGWQMPVMAISALLIGIAWSFGFLTLSIGYLQILSVVFTVILLGLGIDFGIHMISRYELVRPIYPSGPHGVKKAMRDVFQTVGPGIITGAVTTSIAFGTTLLTDFDGMAEMGLIAGVGILLCLVAMFGVLPALIVIWRPRRGHHRQHPERRRLRLFSTAWSMPFSRHPIAVCLVGGVVLIGSAFAVPRVPYDYDFSALLPVGTDSVYWQNVLMEQTDESVFFAVSQLPKDLPRDVVARQVERLRELETVASLGGIATLYPSNQAEREARILAAVDELGPLLRIDASVTPRHDQSDDLVTAAGRLRTMLAAANRMMEAGQDPALQAGLRRVISDLQTIQEILPELPDEIAAKRLDAMNESFQGYRRFIVEQIRGGVSTRPLTIADMPDVLKLLSLSRSGETQAILIYPAGNINNIRELEAFIAEIRTVDPLVTGTVVQFYESSILIRSSYQLAGVLAFLAVLILVWLDFRSITEALLAMVPVVFAFFGVFVMLLIGRSLTGPEWGIVFSINPANIIVLPLLFGIGIDAGVHVLHRYKQAPLDRPLGLTAGTGKGITLTSLTTIIGFASMMIAHHRGIISLGLVLAVGVGLTLIACLVIMPAVLELLTRWRMRNE